VGKYNRGTDAYLSIVRALGHAAIHANRRLEYKWVDSEHLQDEASEEVSAHPHHTTRIPRRGRSVPSSPPLPAIEREIERERS
jgi:CTP synthase (UTP-ammonia lyase)